MHGIHQLVLCFNLLLYYLAWYAKTKYRRGGVFDDGTVCERLSVTAQQVELLLPSVAWCNSVSLFLALVLFLGLVDAVRRRFVPSYGVDITLRALC